MNASSKTPWLVAIVIATLQAAALVVATTASGFAWSLYTNHRIHSPRSPDPLRRVYHRDLFILNSARVPPEYHAFAIDRHLLGTLTYDVQWDGELEQIMETLPARVPPPAWSVHNADETLRWPDGVDLDEIAVGVPLRCMAVVNGHAAPLGMAAADLGPYGAVWRVRWWALLVNIAFFVPIVLALRKGPWAALWLRRYLRRRRGLCVSCAYPVRGLPLCPECGKAVEGAASGVAP